MCVTRVAGDAKMTELHDVVVKQGGGQQIIFWIGFLEIFRFSVMLISDFL